jgi:hypothetical protein
MAMYLPLTVVFERKRSGWVGVVWLYEGRA